MCILNVVVGKLPPFLFNLAGFKSVFVMTLTDDLKSFRYLMPNPRGLRRKDKKLPLVWSNLVIALRRSNFEKK